MKAINTKYKGYNFRSRLEARWAVFFDSLGIEWEYEKEGYKFEDGTYYLPDFWLPELDCFIEIKGVAPNKNDDNKAANLAKNIKKKVMIFYGDISKQIDNGNESAHMFCDDGWDCFYKFCECRKCKKIGIEFDGRSDRIDCCGENTGHGDKGYNTDSPRLIEAYNTAKSARFEFGENEQ